MGEGGLLEGCVLLWVKVPCQKQTSVPLNDKPGLTSLEGDSLQLTSPARAPGTRGEDQTSHHSAGTPQTFALLIGCCLIKRQASRCTFIPHFQEEPPSPAPPMLPPTRRLINTLIPASLNLAAGKRGGVPRQRYPWNGVAFGSNQQPLWPAYRRWCNVPVF